MTDSKQVTLRRPIVKPEWIYDSVNQKQLKSHLPYLLFKPESPLKFNDMANSDIEDKMSTSNGDLDLNDPNIRAKVCTAPNFIQKYFQSSRLHHLSTWKQELIRYTSKAMKINSFDVGKNAIMHIDMDCFFCSVAMRNRPDLVQEAVVIAHSNSGDSSSTAEIASCNYVARKFGIKNGSSLGKARVLCPDLVVLPYDFDAIIKCSASLYKVLLKHGKFVKAVSCDEAYIAIPLSVDDPMMKAEQIRSEILDATSCVASIGIGYSMLMARLATNRAKPNGAYSLIDGDMDSIADFNLSELPGAGWRTISKLSDQQIFTIGQVQQMAASRLKDLFGEVNGLNLYYFSRGIDTRPLENKVQQTVGAEINWAIRFRNDEEVTQFVKDLCEEVFRRIKAAEISSKHVTVTAKKRNYEGEPSKYLGCGHCIDYSKSFTSERLISNSHHLFQLAIGLLRGLKIRAGDIRGIGVHLKSENQAPPEVGQPKINFKSLRSNETEIKFRSENIPKTPSKRKAPMDFFSPNSKAKKPIDGFESIYGISKSQIDPNLICDLPPDIRRELGLASTETPSPLKYKEFEDHDCNPRFSQIDPEILKCLPKSIQIEQRSAAVGRSKMVASSTEEVVEVYLPPKFGEETNVESIWQQLRMWINNSDTTTPSSRDLQMVSSYLCSLIDDFELENCCRILREMSIKYKHSVPWNTAFLSILADVNEKVFHNYGNYLDPRLFSVCQGSDKCFR